MQRVTVLAEGLGVAAHRDADGEWAPLPAATFNGPRGGRVPGAAPERAMRRRLAAAYRVAAMLGWDHAVYNHITARVPGEPSRFLLNPFGVHFSEVTAGGLVKVDADGRVADPASVGRVLLAAFIIHSAVHEARPDVHCVLHSHLSAAVSVSVHPRGLLPLTQDAVQALAAGVTYHPFEGFASDPAECARIAQSLGGRAKILLLRNHGVLVCGGSVEEAVYLMHVVQRACEHQDRALAAAGGDVARLVAPTAEEAERFTARLRGAHDLLRAGAPGAAPDVGDTQYHHRLLFDALVRRVERLDGGAGYAA